MQKNVIDAISSISQLAIIQNLKYRKLWPRPQDIQKSLDLCTTCEDSLAAWFEEFRKNEKSI